MGLMYCLKTLKLLCRTSPLPAPGLPVLVRCPRPAQGRPDGRGMKRESVLLTTLSSVSTQSHTALSFLICPELRLFFGVWHSGSPCTGSTTQTRHVSPGICEFPSIGCPGSSQIPSPRNTCIHSRKRCLNFIKPGQGEISGRHTWTYLSTQIWMRSALALLGRPPPCAWMQ